MRQYFDASVIGTLVFRDADWDVLRTWIVETTPSLIYSDFGLGELASAISRRVRMQQLGADEGRKVLADLPLRFREWSQINLVASDVAVATGYVSRFDLGLRLPDAIHIAIAARLACPLVTSDGLQYRAAAALGIPTINPLLPEGIDRA